MLARRGAHVMGIDLSRTMVEEARRRAALEGVASRWHSLEGDLVGMDLGRTFPLVSA
jgi:2-polyprenyl-3-methyl-5-hydroxy-6-metoxy-1,4-benzoquinol methylase